MTSSRDSHHRRFEWLVASLVMVCLLFIARPARAHKPSDAYLTLEVDGAVIHGRWDIAVRDLDYALDIDVDGDGKITWSELRERRLEIVAYATSRLAVSSDTKPCAIADAKDAAAYAVASHSDGAYVVLRFEARCPESPKALAIGYRLFFDIDAQHRGLLRLDAGGSSRTHAFSSREHEATFDLADAGRLRQLGVITKEGILHIWKGYDHVLFLLALLLFAT
jgi:hypothetical protein